MSPKHDQIAENTSDQVLKQLAQIAFDITVCIAGPHGRFRTKQETNQLDSQEVPSAMISPE